jgi:hypothetical protein
MTSHKHFNGELRASVTGVEHYHQQATAAHILELSPIFIKQGGNHIEVTNGMGMTTSKTLAAKKSREHTSINQASV